MIFYNANLNSRLNDIFFEIREVEIKMFLHQYCQTTFFILIGKNKFAIWSLGSVPENTNRGGF